MKQIIPCLWFDDQTEEAVEFYSSVFGNTNKLRTDYYTEAGKEQHGHNSGDVMTVEFEIHGRRFMGLNGGPLFKFTPAISFFFCCKSIEEVNSVWNKLSRGAKVLMPLDAYPFSKRYGWLSDKFGVSWQIILDEEQMTQKIFPSLLFVGERAGKAEEAMEFYVSVFKNSSIGTVARYGADQAPDKEGTVSYGEFKLDGNTFAAMDSAQTHKFDFTEAISFTVECKDQNEVDYYWEKLSAVPEAEQCGWLKDKYGVSWQIVPASMNQMFQNGTPEQLERVIAAFLPMKKLDVAKLERVYNEKL